MKTFPISIVVGLGLALAATTDLTAQTFDLPTISSSRQPATMPIGGPRMRYQQWYSPQEWLTRAVRPVRVNGLQFKAHSRGTGVAGRQVELEVLMGNSFTTNPISQFETNFQSGRTIVFPRAPVVLPAPTPGSWPVSLGFANEFVWDGSSGVILEIKIWDNGNNNTNWTYDLEVEVSAPSRITRLWSIVGPTATSASFFGSGQGLVTRFSFAQAIDIPFGNGCPGAGNHVPVARTSGGLPTPANPNYAYLLTNAPSQRNAFFMMGFSRTMWGSTPLPLDLTFIGGVGCSLMVDNAVSVGVSTVGGGPGAGSASLPFGLPASTNWVGVEVFSQWLVLDPLAPNGLLTTSNAIRTITGFN